MINVLNVIKSMGFVDWTAVIICLVVYCAIEFIYKTIKKHRNK